jgi:DUF4097 and DUF4098 domain-containing protein YvlB
MKGAKIGLLLVILAFGSTVETAWRVRNRLGISGWNWHLFGDRFYGPSFTFNAEQAETVTAETPVEIENSFGAVKVVTGAPGQVRIALREVVFQPTEAKAREFAGRIQLQARREGGALRIGTNRAELEHTSPLGDIGFETHFDIAVPPGTVVKVSNAHGAVDVSDVARADVVSSFDTVRVARVAGPVDIQARHGEVHVTAIKGDLKLSHRHGDVTIEDVEGRSTVDMQHGEFVATRVGSLTLESAHGDVRAETVHGDLSVHAQHAQVRATGVTGRAEIQTSFQGVALEKVTGDATIRTEHGEVSVSDAGGAVDVQATFNDVSLARVAGPVTVAVSHGALRAQGLEKGARVKASGDDVVLDGFRGPVEVVSERASVRLVPASPITDTVKVSATHGPIELDVPAGSRFDLQASVDGGGEITADVPELSTTQTGTGRLAGRVGGGGSAVVLTTSHGDVRLHGSSAVARKTP